MDSLGIENGYLDHYVLQRFDANYTLCFFHWLTGDLGETVNGLLVFMPCRLDLTDWCYSLIYELEQKLFGAETGQMLAGVVWETILFPSVEFRAYDPSFSVVYCPLSKYLSLDVFLATLVGSSVNVASSFKLWISVLSWKPLSSFNIVFLGPHIQPGVAARLIPASNDYFITLGSDQF